MDELIAEYLARIEELEAQLEAANEDAEGYRQTLEVVRAKRDRFREQRDAWKAAAEAAAGMAGEMARRGSSDNETDKENRMDKKPVLVTTEYRGVFFGYAGDISGDTIRLENARLCLYWSRDVKGFMGLASHGPSEDCRVGPPATITLRKVTAVAEVTPEAVERWEAAPWSSR